MPDARTCPNCGSALPARAPEGLCPRCLLGAGLASDALSVGRAGEVGATISLGSGAGVLETIAATLGAVPRVLLRDTDAGPRAAARPARSRGGADDSTRYRIDGEIARGGMGAVLKGRDPDLGRDVAIKVLREDLRGNADMVRRFVEEAQIGGQLQHPGIVPIYELGTFADRRPFFSMKLVKGHTLAALLDGPHGPGRPTCPGSSTIFEADRPDGGLRPRPGGDPPRPEAVERDGRQLRRGPGDGLGPGQGPAPRRRRPTTPRPASPTARRR